MEDALSETCVWSRIAGNKTVQCSRAVHGRGSGRMGRFAASENRLRSRSIRSSAWGALEGHRRAGRRRERRHRFHAERRPRRPGAARRPISPCVCVGANLCLADHGAVCRMGRAPPLESVSPGRCRARDIVWPLLSRARERRVARLPSRRRGWQRRGAGAAAEMLRRLFGVAHRRRGLPADRYGGASQVSSGPRCSKSSGRSRPDVVLVALGAPEAGVVHRRKLIALGIRKVFHCGLRASQTSSPVLPCGVRRGCPQRRRGMALQACTRAAKVVAAIPVA